MDSYHLSFIIKVATKPLDNWIRGAYVLQFQDEGFVVDAVERLAHV